MIVSKFGGSSVANAEQIEKARGIVESDSGRCVVVVSAPGTDEENNVKVTDSLFNIATDGEHFRRKGKDISAKESYDYVVQRFGKLITDLGIEGKDLLERLKADLQSPIEGKKREDFFASRGEHYHAQIIARYFQKRGMKAAARLPEEIGFLVSADFGNAKVLPETTENLRRLADEDGILVVSGYYGITKQGDIAVISRGGSDKTGDRLAYALNASMYEIWSDKDGIYQVDPRQIPEARVIHRLTPKEVRRLAAKGFNIVHYEAMLDCKKGKIPINVRNTDNREAPGTMIVAERVPEETVVGIARLDDVAYIYVEKEMAEDEIGFTDDILAIFRNYEISTHHYPTDTDEISIFVEQKDLVGKANSVVADISSKLKPDEVQLTYDLSLIVPVGIGMRDRPGTLARASTALGDRSINIETVVQTPAQISMIFGVKGYHADNALRALYDEFFGGE
jgi:aspartate kinase